MLGSAGCGCGRAQGGEGALQRNTLCRQTRTRARHVLVLLQQASHLKSRVYNTYSRHQVTVLIVLGRSRAGQSPQGCRGVLQQAKREGLWEQNNKGRKQVGRARSMCFEGVERTSGAVHWGTR